MEKMIIEGGYRLVGEVPVSGPRTAALPLLRASLLVEERDYPPECSGVGRHPDHRPGFSPDGGQDRRGHGTVRLNASKVTLSRRRYNLVKTMRASVLVSWAPGWPSETWARVFPLPGGCAMVPAH